ncbi:MAG: cobalt ECF transporter T component CbiQ, partial [Microcystaceae cyanobacterium]
MKLVLDRYAHLNSPIHQWEQRSKLIALGGLIIAFAFVQKLILVPAMVLMTILLYVLSRLPFNFWLTRLRYPGLFIIAVVFFLPFASGETVIFQWGMFSLKQEGVDAVILITSRFLSILTVTLVLLGTAPFLNTIKALRSLGLPWIMIDMMLLTYRYLEEFGDMLQQMQRSIHLKGFRLRKLNKRNLRIVAQLMGTLIIRSYERSQRVYQAMILRGYSYAHHISPKFNFAIALKEDHHSMIASGVTLMGSIALILLELF